MPFEPYAAQHYLADAETIWSRCEDLARAFPEYIHHTEIGRTHQDRPIGLLTFCADHERAETLPSIWIDAGTHASEWCGVSAAMFIASEWARALEAGDDALRAWLTQHAAYILPCVSPDGYDAMRKGAPYLRSSLRPPRHDALRTGFEPRDVDGDGAVRWMRWKHPAGPLVADPDVPMYMRPRTLDDDPSEAFFLCDEGVFLEWDGAAWTSAPRAFGVDLNRNFPASWAPFSMFGMDAGAYALSEPESRALTDAFAARPNIGAALTFHTYTGCILTQPYRKDTPLERPDIDLMSALAQDLVEGTDYDVYKVCPEFMYDPDKPTVGVWSDTISTTFGVPGYTVEFWDPFGYAGVSIDAPAAFFLDPDPDKIRGLVDAFSRREGTVTPWESFKHPQLGPVEIGGLDYLRTIRNPPEALLLKECHKGWRMAERLRRALPRVEATSTVEALGARHYRVEVTLENQGFLPTSGLAHAVRIGATPDVHARLVTDDHNEGLRIVDGAALRQGEHLPGWGNARVGAARHPIYASLGDRSLRTSFAWVVRGDGEVSVQWRAGRAGAGVMAIPLQEQTDGDD